MVAQRLSIWRANGFVVASRYSGLIAEGEVQLSRIESSRGSIQTETPGRSAYPSYIPNIRPLIPPS